MAAPSGGSATCRRGKVGRDGPILVCLYVSMSNETLRIINFLCVFLSFYLICFDFLFIFAKRQIKIVT